MKNPNRETVSQLELLPNIGKVLASDLRLIGINKPQDLNGKDPFELYADLCSKKGKKVDYCVIDVFMSVVDFMEGAEPQAWWKFTQKRKQMFQEENK